MDVYTKKTICLIIGIASILTIVGTISYAYFSAIGEVKPAESVINTATAGVKFSDYGDEIGERLNFGESITKKFTLENTGTVDTTVRMTWYNLVNTYQLGSLTYTLSYSTEENGTYVDLESNKNVPRVPRPLSLERLLKDDITIPAGETYFYRLVITLNYLNDVNQDDDLNAIFSSKFKVEDNTIPPIKETILNFDNPALTDEGVFEMEDDYGTSYYFRGAVENNYVKFANFYWRIIRVNGDDSLRIIYDGTIAHMNGDANDDRLISIDQPFNSSYKDAKYVGWMFGGVQGKSSTSKEQAQKNETDSDIKIVVDTWYKENIEDKGYGQYVNDTLFCNDRSIPGQSITLWTRDTGLGFSTHDTAYGAFGRFLTGNNGPSDKIKENVHPILICPQKNDAFTVDDVTKGNGALTYPVGLITADEIVTAGSGKYGTTNNQYYLYRSSKYRTWALSPVMIAYQLTYVSAISTSGSLGYGETNVGKRAVAPVINLTPNYVNSMVGDGTMNNPYRAPGVTP